MSWWVVCKTLFRFKSQSENQHYENNEVVKTDHISKDMELDEIRAHIKKSLEEASAETYYDLLPSEALMH